MGRLDQVPDGLPGGGGSVGVPLQGVPMNLAGNDNQPMGQGLISQDFISQGSIR